MSYSSVKAGNAYVELAIKDHLARGLANASRRMKLFGAQMTGIGKSMLMVSAAAAAPLAMSSKVFANYEAALSKVRAITGATNQDMALLSATAKKLGANTQFSASEVAEAMTYLGMAGYRTKEIIAGIGDVLSLAAAGGLELAEAADIASDVASAFGLSADQIGRVADVIAKTASSANTSVSMMGESFKYVAPLAAAAGQDIEGAAAAIGVLGNSGIKASTAGTDLALIMKKLSETAVQKHFRDIGVSIAGTTGEIKPLLEIMSDLEVATSQMSEQNRLGFFAKIFGRSAKSALVLQANTKELGTLTAALKSAKGEAGRMAEVMNDNLAGSAKTLLSAIEGLAIQVGEAIRPAIRGLIGDVTQVTRRISNWVDNNEDAINSALNLTIAIAALGTAYVSLGIASKGAALAMAPASKVGFIMSGFVVLAAGLTAELNNGRIAGYEYSEAIHKIGVELGLLSDKYERVAKSSQNLQNAMIAQQNIAEQINLSSSPKNKLPLMHDRIQAIRKAIPERERYLIDDMRSRGELRMPSILRSGADPYRVAKDLNPDMLGPLFENDTTLKKLRNELKSLESGLAEVQKQAFLQAQQEAANKREEILSKFRNFVTQASGIASSVPSEIAKAQSRYSDALTKINNIGKHEGLESQLANIEKLRLSWLNWAQDAGVATSEVIEKINSTFAKQAEVARYAPNQKLDDQIAELTINTGPGSNRSKALDMLELEQKRRLESATQSGESIAKINKLFDLKKQSILNEYKSDLGYVVRKQVGGIDGRYIKHTLAPSQSPEIQLLRDIKKNTKDSAKTLQQKDGGLVWGA